MVKILNPTLDEYMLRVRGLSEVYRGDPGMWYKLTLDEITDEDDRDEFSFIRMALWDKLMEREFFPPETAQTRPRLLEKCDSVEPGNFPGSTFLGGDFWELTNTQNSLLAC